MTSVNGSASPETSDRSFLGHPKGLAVLFFTEMWERFSYYGMRAMLVTYLLWHFLKSETNAYGIYAAYAGMIYLMPMVGGYLADKLLGPRKAIAFGALMITLGHFAMAVEGGPPSEVVISGDQRFELTRERNPEGDTPQFIRTVRVEGTERRVENLAVEGRAATVTYRLPAGGTATIDGRIERRSDPFGENMMFLALAFVIIGTGYLKANISAIVGTLYGPRDERRDAGFTLFYMSINIGALMGIASVGYIGIEYGWAYGFGLAGIGMLAGLVVFILGRGWLQGRGEPPDPEYLKEPVFGPLNREWCVYIGSFLAVGAAWLVVKYLGQLGVGDFLALFGLSVESVPLIGEFTVFDLLVNLTFIALIIGVVAFSISRLEPFHRDRMIALVVLTFSSVVFWTLFDQAPISLLVFQTQFVQTGIFTAQQIAMFNPAFIILLAPLFILLWQMLARRGREPSTPLKFAFGLAQVGGGFLVLYLGIVLTGGELAIGIGWIALLYLFHTTGELCLSPVGLSAVTRLAVPQLVGFMMGVWLMSFSLAQVTASIVSKATVVPEGTERAVALAQFAEVYLWLGLASVAVGLLMAALTPWLKSMMHEGTA